MTDLATSRQVWYLNTLVNRRLKIKAADWLPRIKAADSTAFFTASAEWLADQGVGKTAVGKAIKFLANKQRKSWEDVWAILGLTDPTAATTKAPATTKPAKPTTKPAPEAGDAKAILASAFASGAISIAEFTEAIAALGVSAKRVEVPVEVEPIELDAEGTSDLPF